MDIRKYRKSKYLKSTDIDSGAQVLAISSVKVERMRSGDDEVVVQFHEKPDKSWVLNNRNKDSLMEILGFDGEDWIGQRVELYTIPEPMAATGEAIRVRRPTAAAATRGIDINDDIPF